MNIYWDILKSAGPRSAHLCVGLLDALIEVLHPRCLLTAYMAPPSRQISQTNSRQYHPLLGTTDLAPAYLSSPRLLLPSSCLRCSRPHSFSFSPFLQHIKGPLHMLFSPPGMLLPSCSHGNLLLLRASAHVTLSGERLSLAT